MADVIDIHSHFLAASLVQALERRDELPRITGSAGKRLIEYGRGNVHPLLPEMGDIELRLRDMDTQGIDLALISANIPGVDWFSASDGPAIARAVNDELAALVAAHPSRLAALATLPMQVPVQAASELGRAMAAGFCGAMIYSNVAGQALDDPRFRVVFDAAAELDAPLYIHPTFPLTAGTVDAHALIPALGFMFDTTTAAVRVVLDGLYERHPAFKLILAHAASLLPQLAGRIDYEAERHSGGRGALTVEPSEHLRLIYTDTVTAWAPALDNTIALVGPERVMFGSDYPFWDPATTFETIARANLSNDVMAAMRSDNARRLFRLDRDASQVRAGEVTTGR